MGWGYWELSGGADFAPERWPVAERPAGMPAPNLVTRADTTTLSSIDDIADPAPQDAAIAAAINDVLAASEEPGAQTPVADDFIAESVAAALAAPVAETVPETRLASADLREVNGDRVNMREGPGTDFGVVDQLLRGTVIEVIELGGNGWVRVRVDASGRSGWVSDQFLIALNG